MPGRPSSLLTHLSVVGSRLRLPHLLPQADVSQLALAAVRSGGAANSRLLPVVIVFIEFGLGGGELRERR